MEITFKFEIFIIFIVCIKYHVIKAVCTDRAPLGMRNGLIHNSQISSSSERYLEAIPDNYDEHGRLDEASAWCTRDRGVDGQWIQISFDKTTHFTGVAIQDDAMNTGFSVTDFQVWYWLGNPAYQPSDSDFILFETFAGLAMDVSEKIVYRWFDTPINATVIRIVVLKIRITNVYETRLACLRMELYGCLNQNEMVHLPLGMESEIIRDTQISKSLYSYNPGFARFLNKGVGLKSQTDVAMYLQITFDKAMRIESFNIQGGQDLSMKYGYVPVFELYAFNETTDQFLFIQEFNNSERILGFDPFFAKLLQPVTTKNIRFKKVNSGIAQLSVIKVEIYGYDPVYSKSLHEGAGAASEILSVIPPINSNSSTCITSGNNISLEFLKPLLISGIVVQGDSNKDSWVNEFELTYVNLLTGESNKSVYIGCKSRCAPLSVNWFPEYIYTSRFVIRPTQCTGGQCCMRIDLKGVDSVLSAPVNLNIVEGEDDVYIYWLKPTLTLLPIQSYKVYIQASKSYNETFEILEEYTTEKAGFVKKQLYHGANVTVKIVAVVSDYLMESTERTQLFPPQKPPAANIESFEWRKTSADGYLIVVERVSDIMGPISEYEIFISEGKSLVGSSDPLSVLSYQYAQEANLHYFLGASIRAENNAPMAFNFTNGKKTVEGIYGYVATFGNFYLCARANILAEDIKKYGFTGGDYFGTISCQELIRNHLPELETILFNADGFPIVKLTYDPAILYYKIIVIEASDTKIPSSGLISNEIKSFQNKQPSEPYVTAIIDSKNVMADSNFVIGDGQEYKLPPKRRKKRSPDTYINGKLEPGKQYQISVLGVDKKGDSISSPWSEPFSAQEVKSNVKKEDDSSSLIPIIIGVLVFLLVVILLIIIYMKFRGKNAPVKSLSIKESSVVKKPNIEIITSSAPIMKDQSSIAKTEKKTSSGYQQVGNVESFSLESLEKRATEENGMDLKFRNSSHPPSDFPTYYLKQKENMHLDLVRQFQSVPLTRKVGKKNIANMPMYKSKNRYMNIVPYNHSRVILPPTNLSPLDYINASYIKGVYREKTFIAAQAPKTETICDFWRMIYFEKTPVVVMLTNLKENGKVKCVQYWPDENEATYGDMHITVTDMKLFADFTQRKMTVTYEKESHYIVHYHFKAWPDHGVPDYPTMLLDFIRRMRQVAPHSELKPILAHCSAGVGRTGTLIAIDAMLECLEKQDNIDVYKYYQSLRNDRMQMVQTVEQYLFIYSAIYESITCGHTLIPSEDFNDFYAKLIAANDGRSSLLTDEFEKQGSITPMYQKSHYVNAVLPANRSKNRFPDILPRDMDRVILAEDEEGSNYINAVYVNGYRNENLFIVTQAPLNHTIQDYWLMVWSHNITTIVNLLTEEETEDFTDIFSPDVDFECRDVLVSVTATEQHEYFEEKKVNLVTAETDTTISMFTFTSWKNKSIPKDTSMLIKLVDDVIKAQQLNGNQKILVTCSDGGNRSGTFVACMNGLDQVKVEQHVDIFQIVRRLKLIRPQFVENEEQYRFIYKVLSDYLHQFETYSNFI